MNLIEQLGGYEAAKAGSEARHRSGITPCELDRQLLEYRRANNTFEVGDKVVHFFESDEIFEIKSIKGDYFIIEGNRNTLIGISFLFDKTCRHATDAEIKAGKRLEVV